MGPKLRTGSPQQKCLESIISPLYNKRFILENCFYLILVLESKLSHLCLFFDIENDFGKPVSENNKKNKQKFFEPVLFKFSLFMLIEDSIVSAAMMHKGDLWPGL